MAKIIGVDCGIKGKVGNHIYSTWKGVQVLKTMFIPSNPKTVKQTVNRNNFSKLIQIGKVLVAHFLPQTYNDLSHSKTTGWANWLSQNLTGLSNSSITAADLKFGKGSLYSPGIESAINNGGEVKITFDDTLYQDAAMNDFCFGIVYHEDLNEICISQGSDQRGDAQVVISIPISWRSDKCTAYLMFYKDNEVETCIAMSESSNSVITDL